MPNAQNSKDLEKKSFCYPHDAHLAFMACVFEYPEVLEKFDKMREFYSDILPYFRSKKEPEEESISFQKCREDWCRAAQQLCCTLSYVLGEEKASRLERYLMAIPDMSNAHKHIMPGTGNTNPELFNKREFVKCLAWPIYRFNLFEGHKCFNLPMSNKALVQILIGADIETGEVSESSSVADFGDSKAETIEYWLKHRGSANQWNRGLLDLYETT